jgi:hypothetical protein
VKSWGAVFGANRHNAYIYSILPLLLLLLLLLPLFYYYYYYLIYRIHEKQWRVDEKNIIKVYWELSMEVAQSHVLACYVCMILIGLN